MSIKLAKVPGGQVDARIAPDVRALLRRFGLKITASYATTGHAADGEHPLGLALDLVPIDGDWSRTARAAAFAHAHPNTFRWIGYNGQARHGDPAHAGANAHLHLSWFGRPGTSVHPALAGKGSTKAVGSGRFRTPARNPDGSPAAGNNPVAQYGPDNAASDAAGFVVNQLVGGLEKTGARLLVTVGLILAGAVLALYGVMRATGISTTDLAAAAAAPETGGASLAVAAGAKQKGVS